MRYKMGQRQYHTTETENTFYNNNNCNNNYSELRQPRPQDIKLWDTGRRKPAAAGNRNTTPVRPTRQIQTSPRPTHCSAKTRHRKARYKKTILRKFISRKFISVFSILFCLFLICKLAAVIRDLTQDYPAADFAEEIFEPLSERSGSRISPPAITEDFLEINDYSRPGTPLQTVKNIFVHYTANPGTTAEQNRSYFANLAETHERSASAHFIIGYDGKLIQCIPMDEEAYAVMTRNSDSISIECCFLDKDGSFTQETYDTLIHTLAWLIDKYQLSTDDILRHYDCGGKLCPLYYVEHEDAWNRLLQDVADYSAGPE